MLEENARLKMLEDIVEMEFGGTSSSTMLLFGWRDACFDDVTRSRGGA